MKQIEQELKLELTEREFSILSKNAHRGAKPQTNYYFCYNEMPIGEMVRLRQRDYTYELCLKRKLQQKDNIFVSTERNCELTADLATSFVKNGITKEQIKNMLGLTIGGDLYCVGNILTERTVTRILGLEVELDKSFILDDVVFELECECNSVDKLAELKHFLVQQYGIVLKESQPKSKRFFDKLEGYDADLTEVLKNLK